MKDSAFHTFKENGTKSRILEKRTRKTGRISKHNVTMTEVSVQDGHITAQLCTFSGGS